MKKIILLTICLLFLITLPSLVFGDGFLNCDRESFSFSDLRYYKEGELVEGYCTCKSLSEKNQKLNELSMKLGLSYLKLGRTLQSDKAWKDAEEYKNRGNTAKVNMDRILRILEKEYKHKDVPSCPKEE